MIRRMDSPEKEDAYAKQVDTKAAAAILIYTLSPASTQRVVP